MFVNVLWKVAVADFMERGVTKKTFSQSSHNANWESQMVPSKLESGCEVTCHGVQKWESLARKKIVAYFKVFYRHWLTSFDVNHAACQTVQQPRLKPCTSAVEEGHYVTIPFL